MATNLMVGSQVRPRVCSIGVQCSIGDGEIISREHKQRYTMLPPLGISEESESEMSQCSYDQPGDLDTSAYTVEDESSS